MSISRPIVYGNTAVPLPDSERTDKTPPDHTHKWTIFVRDPNYADGKTPNKKDNTNGGDLSYFIKKVVFKLHDTYPQPSRSIETPPFELTETGWGEFEIAVKIYFSSEANEKNVATYHHLKLHPYGEEAQQKSKENGGLVESYLYDELVFNEPTEAMFEILTSRPGAVLPAKKSETVKYSTQAESEELDRLSSGLESVYQQVQKTKDTIQKLETEKKRLEDENEKRKQKAAAALAESS